MIDSNYTQFNNILNSSVIDQKLANFLNTSYRTFIEKLINEHNVVEFKFKTEFLADDFRPSEIKLKLNGATLIVEAVKELKTFKSVGSLNIPTGNDASFFSNFKESEKFKREIELPSFLDLATLSCYLETYQRVESTLVIETFIEKSSELYRQLHAASLDETECSTETSSRSNNYYDNKSFDSSSNQEDSLFELRLPPVIKPRSSTKPAPKPSSAEYLKFKFDLKGYDSNNISLSIKNRSVLHIQAIRVANDAHGQPRNEEFNHEINLPSNVEIFNIRNCFDESDGVLKIEIPFIVDSSKQPQPQQRIPVNNRLARVEKESNRSTSTNSSNTYTGSNTINGGQSNKQKSALNKNEKYLELTFDLYDFKFDDIRIENEKILIVSAFKEKSDEKPMHGFTCSTANDKLYTRKYVLPNWVRSENIIVSQEKRRVDNKLKNLLILQIPIVS
jgi:HSP20 family molecular chaperone IbpA